MMTLTIDDKAVSVPNGTSIIEAARQVGVKIPTLCAYQPLHHLPGSCRMCLVEVPRQRHLLAACVQPVSDGMVVRTNTKRVRTARRAMLELLLSDHPEECTTCKKVRGCELKALIETLGVEGIHVPRTRFDSRPIDRSSPALTRDPAKCIRCGRCVVVCDQVQSVSILTHEGRGFAAGVGPAMGAALADTVCTACGQCAVVCPTGAVVEKDDTEVVWQALGDKKRYVIAQIAPAVRAALGECFAMPQGALVTSGTVAALKRIGCDRVFDIGFAADVAIMETAEELRHRMAEGGPLPMITSCCPALVTFVQHFYPQLLGHLSAGKSPEQMGGALAKTYYATWAKVDPADIFVVSVSPCTASKIEATRTEMRASGCSDVDAALTTRELGRMIREAGIDFADLRGESFDAPMAIASGAAGLFGVTGGVTEALLRTLFALVVEESLPNLTVASVHGLDNIKATAMKVGALGELRVAVAHGLANARHLLDQIAKRECPYHFIEMMGCRGGCVGGGGQPLPTSDAALNLRSEALYRDDAAAYKPRQSHENPAVRELYENFLGHRLGDKPRALLHTRYTERGVLIKRG